MDNLLVEVRFVADDYQAVAGSSDGYACEIRRAGARHLAERFADGALAWAENGLIINRSA